MPVTNLPCSWLSTAKESIVELPPAPPDAPEDERRADRDESRPHRDQRKRQCRQRLVRRELVAGNAGQREVNRDAADIKPLAERQDSSVPAAAASREK